MDKYALTAQKLRIAKLDYEIAQADDHADNAVLCAVIVDGT